ncbi:MAG TPA: Lsm family RNA-binding protein [Candidatus Saccharimonadales bacterium]|nr:Lsm family RNA-binding protein [Candidatus Saccharimonadales bacterium]
MSAVADRRFMEEIASLLQKGVTVSTSNGKNYTGILSGVDSHSLNVCLSAAKDETGKVYHKLFLSGSSVTQIFSSEKPFDLQALADRLDRVFPRMVKVSEGAGIIVVMDRIRVSEKGILEGSGPAAERVQKVYEEFIRGQT